MWKSCHVFADIYTAIKPYLMWLSAVWSLNPSEWRPSMCTINFTYYNYLFSYRLRLWDILDSHNFINHRLQSYIDRSSSPRFFKTNIKPLCQTSIPYTINYYKTSRTNYYKFTCAKQHTSQHRVTNTQLECNMRKCTVPWLQVILKFLCYYFNNQNKIILYLTKVYLESTIWCKLNLIFTPVLKL